MPGPQDTPGTDHPETVLIPLSIAQQMANASVATLRRVEAMDATIAALHSRVLPILLRDDERAAARSEAQAREDAERLAQKSVLLKALTSPITTHIVTAIVTVTLSWLAMKGYLPAEVAHAPTSP